MGRNTTILAAGFLLCWASGCGDDSGANPTDAPSGRDAAHSGDALITTDALPSLAWVDFTITGCESGSTQLGTGDADAGVTDPCVGPAPLTLQFTAIAPSAINLYRWVFETVEVNDATPVHTFSTPGSYDVALTVGGPGGTAMTIKTGIIVVTPAPLGHACTDDGQCDSGECVCDGATNCVAGLASGLCSTGCDPATPCADGTCVDLAIGGTGGEDWQRSLCLPPCTDNSDCPDALVCRDVIDADGAWTRACFASGLLGDIGESCQNAGGNPDDTLCTSGVCLSEGARGVCSQACTKSSCPDGTACATFNSAPSGSWCVARCDSPATCTSDPWLACEPPGSAGTKGFSVDEKVMNATYCAPKSCTTAAECGPDGDCVNDFCAPL